MSFAAKDWAYWGVRGLKASAKTVLYCLADYADDRNQCWPSYETLALKGDLSRTSVYNGIKELKERGLITITRRRNEDKQMSNLYTLQVKPYSKPDQSSKQSSKQSQTRVQTRVQGCVL